jgi:hypothetical protein
MNIMEDFIVRNTKPDNYSNYFEIHLCNRTYNDIDDAVDIYNTSLDREQFYNLMYKMMDTNYRYHQKQYKETVIGDVCYQNYKNEEMNICNLQTNTIESITDKLFVIAQTKNKLSILSVPSTLNIYSENIIRRLIFRISNRVFVNFENGMTDNNKYYKVFINYNHDKDVDVNVVVRHIKDAVDKLTE